MLGLYGEPEVEPDVSSTSSAAARLRCRLAAALLTQARLARDRRGGVACCFAERAGVTAASPLARALWNTGVLSWVTWPCTGVCAAAGAASAEGAAAGCAALLCPVGPGAVALARRARRLRVALARCVLRLAMQDLPRVRCKPLRAGQARLQPVTLPCNLLAIKHAIPMQMLQTS